MLTEPRVKTSSKVFRSKPPGFAMWLLCLIPEQTPWHFCDNFDSFSGYLTG